MAVPGSPSWGSEGTRELGSPMECCVSGMWGVMAGLPQLFRGGVGIYEGLLCTRLGGSVRGAQWSVRRVFLCCGPPVSLALGGALIRSFILAASFPEGKGTGIDYLFYLEQEEVVGDWWLAAGRGWGVRGA